MMRAGLRDGFLVLETLQTRRAARIRRHGSRRGSLCPPQPRRGHGAADAAARVTWTMARIRLALLAAALLALVGWKFMYLHPTLDSGAPRVERYGETGDGFDATGEDLEAGWREEFAKRLAADRRKVVHNPAPEPARDPELKRAKQSTCVAVAPDDGFGRMAVRFGASGARMALCEAKLRCRRMGPQCVGFVRTAPRFVEEAERITFLTRGELHTTVKQGRGAATLFIALYGNRGDMLRTALRAYDAGGRLQTRASAYAAPSGAPVFLNQTTHGTTTYDVAPTRDEFWLDLPNQNMATVDGGLCEAKRACALQKRCRAFVYRVRDGAAVLYAGSTLASPGAPPTVAKRSQKRNKAKTVRRIYRKLDVSSPTTRVCVAPDGAVAATLFDDMRIGGDLVGDERPTQLTATPRVVVTLTTLPGRIHQIRKVLESLLEQTLNADEIRVYAPDRSSREQRMYETPPWLAAMAPRVRLVRGVEDYGPATKLIPAVRSALETNDDALLVVVDDDTLYPPRLLETLASWSRRFPDAAVSATGWPVARSLRYPHWTENYLVYGNELVAPHAVSVVRGNCGFAVKARFFDEALWAEMKGAPAGSTVMDDVWISGMLARRGVKRYVVPFDADQYTSDPKLQNVMTLDSNLGKGVANRQAANEAGLRYFKQHWDIMWDPPRQEPISALS